MTSSENSIPADIVDLFSNFVGGDGLKMNTDHLLRFLIEFQGEVDTTVCEAQKLVENLTEEDGSGLSVEGFVRYLFSGDLNPPIQTKVHHDTTLPLSHYYVFTGHNSYLAGNQLVGDSSVVPIITALDNGVRVIELDVWPNGSKDDVDVLHGWTLTSPIKLSQSLYSIKEHAFASSPFPAVVNLEDHLTSDLQAKVAEMFLDIFGDALFYPESGSLDEFPSLDDLKKRVMLSTTPPEECLEGGGGGGKREVDEEEDLRNIASIIKYDPVEKDDANFLKDEEDNSATENYRKLIETVSPEYWRLITITVMNPEDKWRTSLKVNPNKVRLLNLSETQLLQATESYGTCIIRFTQKKIVRVYPNGTRILSSNYNPLLGWMHGVQMVAFNMQGHGSELWLMQGFFRSNGGCGYVKKPDILMNNHGFDPNADLPVKITLKVKVYMGRGWQREDTDLDNFGAPDFYTKVGIAGVPVDTVMKETKVIDNNLLPIWNEEFEFPLAVPELALLQIEVYDKDLVKNNDFSGQTCLPVTELRSGIRAVPLYDSEGVKHNGVVLLMRFEFSAEKV